MSIGLWNQEEHLSEMLKQLSEWKDQTDHYEFTMGNCTNALIDEFGVSKPKALEVFTLWRNQFDN